MRKNRICARLLAALLLAVLPVFLFAGCGSKDPVLAKYKDTEITRSLVDHWKEVKRQLGGGAVSDKDMVDEILVNTIMLDEAESRGLSVTQEEIDAMLQSQHDNYDAFEEIRTIIDDYCKEQDMTTEQYFAVLEEQIPRSILRQKLRDALGQEYCAEHGLEFTKVNPPQEMTDYVNAYLDGLLDSYSAYITYNID